MADPEEKSKNSRSVDYYVRPHDPNIEYENAVDAYSVESFSISRKASGFEGAVVFERRTNLETGEVTTSRSAVLSKGPVAYSIDEEGVAGLTINPLGEGVSVGLNSEGDIVFGASAPVLGTNGTTAVGQEVVLHPDAIVTNYGLALNNTLFGRAFNGFHSFVNDNLRSGRPGLSESHCFLSDTAIQMWPINSPLKPDANGLYDQEAILQHVWSKPINEIEAGDIVVAFDAAGRLQPGKVARTMTNASTHVLDFWGTGMTPGHACYCAEGHFADQHVPIIDILRTDGALMRADSSMFRAATNCDVGSVGDLVIHASASKQKLDGSWSDPKVGKVRFGTRVILPDGQDRSLQEIAEAEGWGVSEDGYMLRAFVDDDGVTKEQKFVFPFLYAEDLPNPEDYILACSRVTLEAIYAAGEWEQIGTNFFAPDTMVGLNTNHTSRVLRPSKPMPNIPTAFETHPDAPELKTQKVFS